MAKERLIWADSLKGWLMILVIVGHVIQGVLSDSFASNHVWNLIYSFHMPAFMAVSGWLSFRMTGCSTPPRPSEKNPLKV
jgi:fucose 4-O-acetylase-like acetyltransferase